MGLFYLIEILKVEFVKLNFSFREWGFEFISGLI